MVMTSSLCILIAIVTASGSASRTSDAEADYFEREARREAMLLPALETTDEWRRQRDEILQDVLEKLQLQTDARLRNPSNEAYADPPGSLSEEPLSSVHQRSQVCHDATGTRIRCREMVRSRDNVEEAAEMPIRRPNIINTLVKRNRMLAYWRRRPDETSQDPAYNDDSFGINVSETKEMVKRYKSTAYDCIALYCADLTQKERYDCILRQCHHAE